MCILNFTNKAKIIQSKAWEENSIQYGRYNHLFYVRSHEAKINQYYIPSTGSFVSNNGKGYWVKSERKNSHIFTWLADIFNGNYTKYKRAKRRHDTAAMSVTELMLYHKQLSRIKTAIKFKRTIRMSDVQAKHFSQILRDKLIKRGYKIA